VVEIETCEYPDTNKIMVASGRRGEPGLHKMFRAENTVSYYDQDHAGARGRSGVGVSAISPGGGGRGWEREPMKMVLTTATTPGEYIECLSGWQRGRVSALRQAVLDTVPEFNEQLKWGHLVYLLNGPVLLIRSEPARVLLGFWRGQRLRHIEDRLKPGGKYEMATLDLRPTTPLERDTVVRLVEEASRLNRQIGDPVRQRGSA
jgi:hypothetical protein